MVQIYDAKHGYLREHNETGSIYCWVCLLTTRQCASQERTNDCAFPYQLNEGQARGINVQEVKLLAEGPAIGFRD